MTKELKRRSPSKTSRSHPVKQHNRLKTSSAYPSCEIKGMVRLVVQRPKSTNIIDGHIVGSYCGGDRQASEYEDIRATDWKEMPHVALANLPTYDEHRKPTAK